MAPPCFSVTDADRPWKETQNVLQDPCLQCLFLAGKRDEVALTVFSRWALFLLSFHAPLLSDLAVKELRSCVKTCSACATLPRLFLNKYIVVLSNTRPNETLCRSSGVRLFLLVTKYDQWNVSVSNCVIVFASFLIVC